MASAEVIRDPGIINTPQRLTNYTAIITTEINKLSGQVQRVLENGRS